MFSHLVKSKTMITVNFLNSMWNGPLDIHMKWFRTMANGSPCKKYTHGTCQEDISELSLYLPPKLHFQTVHPMFDSTSSYWHIPNFDYV